MQPIHEILSRIQWDKDFGDGTFELGIYDRVADEVLRLAMHTIDIDPDNKKQLTMTGADGQTIHVPFHRIREVYKDGVVIWQRPSSDDVH